MKQMNSTFRKFIMLARALGMGIALFFTSNLWSNTCSINYKNTIVAVATTATLETPILSFNATPDGQTVKLDWALASESNKYFYTAEKSLDGINFELVDKFDGSGETTFHTVDESPWNGISYYRIKQTDLNGKHNYSKLVTVKLSLNKTINVIVCPNPTTGSSIKLKLLNIPSDKVLVTIFNIVGNQVYSHSIPVTSNEEFSTTITLPNELSQGTYLVKIDAQNATCTKRFIVRKS